MNGTLILYPKAYNKDRKIALDGPLLEKIAKNIKFNSINPPYSKVLPRYKVVESVPGCKVREEKFAIEVEPSRGRVFRYDDCLTHAYGDDFAGMKIVKSRNAIIHASDLLLENGTLDVRKGLVWARIVTLKKDNEALLAVQYFLDPKVMGANATGTNEHIKMDTTQYIKTTLIISENSAVVPAELANGDDAVFLSTTMNKLGKSAYAYIPDANTPEYYFGLDKG